MDSASTIRAFSADHVLAHVQERDNAANQPRCCELLRRERQPLLCRTVRLDLRSVGIAQPHPVAAWQHVAVYGAGVTVVAADDAGLDGRTFGH